MLTRLTLWGYSPHVCRVRDLRPGTGDPRRRVLLVGARVAVLAGLAAALRAIGIGADLAHDAAGVPDEELCGCGAVVLGRAVGEQDREAVRRAFDRAGVAVARVEGFAPIIPLLVAQIENALDRSPAGQRRPTRLIAADGQAASRPPRPAGWS